MIAFEQFRKLFVLVLPAGAAVPIRDWVCLYPVLGLLSCPPSSIKVMNTQTYMGRHQNVYVNISFM